MTGFDMRGALRLTARIALAGAVSLGAMRSASADDAGLHEFFSAMFGGGSATTQAPPAIAVPAGGMDDYRPAHRSRPLTVRLRKATPRLVVSHDVPAKPVKVSIYEDRTLRRGDAVMTSQGIRVFAGSSSWPYAPQDFVSLSDAGRMSQDTSKILAELDRVPRG